MVLTFIIMTLKKQRCCKLHKAKQIIENPFALLLIKSTGMRAHARTHAHTHTQACIHTHAHTHVHTHTRTHTHTHTHNYLHIPKVTLPCTSVFIFWTHDLKISNISSNTSIIKYLYSIDRNRKTIHKAN